MEHYVLESKVSELGTAFTKSCNEVIAEIVPIGVDSGSPMGTGG